MPNACCDAEGTLAPRRIVTVDSTECARFQLSKMEATAAGLRSECAREAGALARALEDFPADLWAQIFPPQRTIMLAATSKIIRRHLEQLRRRVPALVQVKRVEGLEAGLPRLLTRMNITELKVQNLRLGPDGMGWLAGVLGHCVALARLDLRGNEVGAEMGVLLFSCWRGSFDLLLGDWSKK